ncbi:MAG: hypothetical protein A3G32_06760 [Deltaproteobacteria bacterium RIFCSPLOWO2_12_FULL_40_28]|nr:MAG: hypothetical protein A3C45_06805 [Deltaproteobacteria bacterium RIFCSPHIGHO2_02_FULL_40_28]OGQ19340.1 MAG: hypothetical protein A3E27_05010 [Deltaproteobacteria bacterium RIFCSPHIGHO2_12_FULL_40_32]OGQ40436.1 MAG: hypothetical protein A3I69_00060 [Deltaproteobacteria bacterium RIFCSPLOWO2_02_FULL_40_36]OGQ53672.1 MAG: hypothetical protein A3G32_06760 [Deltaproteobacteria bacterium RIFCSPLOWO2_12_FULL_40_28]
MNLTLNTQKNEMSVSQGLESDQSMTHQKYLNELSHIVLTGFEQNQSLDFVTEEITRLSGLDPNTAAELGLHEDPQSIRSQIVEPAWKHLKSFVKDSSKCLADKRIPLAKAGVDCGAAVAEKVLFKQSPLPIIGKCAPVVNYVVQCALEAMEPKR